jgi:hypothetical protein
LDDSPLYDGKSRRNDLPSRGEGSNAIRKQGKAQVLVMRNGALQTKRREGETNITKK